MTLPRFRQRHVHQSLIDHVKSGLDGLGWVTPPINFGGAPVTFVEFQPEEAGVVVAPNTVAITLGDEQADKDEELGAGVQSCVWPLFVDVYGEDDALAVSIAADVKDILRNRIIPLKDYTASTTGVDTQHTIELDTVVIERPAVLGTNLDKRFWRVVKAMTTLYFME